MDSKVWQRKYRINTPRSLTQPKSGLQKQQRALRGKTMEVKQSSICRFADLSANMFLECCWGGPSHIHFSVQDWYNQQRAKQKKWKIQFKPQNRMNNSIQSHSLTFTSLFRTDTISRELGEIQWIIQFRSQNTTRNSIQATKYSEHFNSGHKIQWTNYNSIQVIKYKEHLNNLS